METPELMVRVKLPDPNAYHSGPSGDTEFEVAYAEALAGAVPPGFEAIRERAGVVRPKDSSGMTYVRLRVKDPRAVLAWTVQATRQAAGAIHAIRKAVAGVWATLEQAERIVPPQPAPVPVIGTNERIVEVAVDHDPESCPFRNVEDTDDSPETTCQCLERPGVVRCSRDWKAPDVCPLRAKMIRVVAVKVEESEGGEADGEGE